VALPRDLVAFALAQRQVALVAVVVGVAVNVNNPRNYLKIAQSEEEVVEI
jgi:hypothetical protein